MPKKKKPRNKKLKYKTKNRVVFHYKFTGLGMIKKSLRYSETSKFTI